MTLTPSAARQAYALRIADLGDAELRDELVYARADLERIGAKVASLYRREPLSDRHRAALAAQRKAADVLDVLTVAALRRGIRP